jgi:transposase
MDKEGKRLFRKRLPNALPAIVEALEPFREELQQVAVESTYNWYWLVDGLMEHGYPVKLANPAAIDQYDGLKHADDRTDAFFLAELSRLGILPTGYIYPKADRPVRDLLRRRMLLVQHRTALMLSVQSLLTRQTGSQISCHKILRFSEEMLKELLCGDECLVFTAKNQMDLIETLTWKIKAFEEKVLQKAKLKGEYDLLLTIPGIGMILALTIMLETGDINRFPRAGNYSSYCRCSKAKCYTNGKPKANNNRKNGNLYLAWAYVEAVHHAIRCCPQAKSFYDRKKAKKNGAVATKALSSKWSKAAYYVMKRQEPFDLRRVFG